MKLSLDIEIYLSKKNYSPQDVINNILFFSGAIKNINQSENWFLTGKTKEDALKHKLINNGTVNHEVSDFLIEKLNKKLPLLITSIWDGNTDNIMTSNYICESLDNFQLSLSLKVVNISGLKSKLKNILLNIIKSKNNIAAIVVQTNNYQMDEKNVFPDRIPVGWMLYLNKQITNAQAGINAELINISNEKNKGTLIISTNEVFDGTNEKHIKNANEIEIQLTGYGLLPTYQDLYN
ncbi:Imm52 family immunity protein [Proteus mirabilis]|uniref:Imm52 family immunity protein n=1 Tax=Proteus mirabilis TaxID=584 RepID=UPI0027878FB7|nr:immunity 52 family protein [Proteus mirabilis]HEJ9411954.1 immunity 52 family protein [Proteus mirabilis]HEJ9436501.1 immunity 52 family protein [Proteus mirabilis]